MKATATYNDPWAGLVQVKLVPQPRTDRFWWKRADNGQVVGGQARALPAARAVAYAKWHRSFLSVVVE